MFLCVSFIQNIPFVIFTKYLLIFFGERLKQFV